MKLQSRTSRFDSVGITVIAAKILPKISAAVIKFGSKIVKSLLGFKGLGVAASMGLYTYLFSWQMAIALIGFILVHEYGHLLAMKKCGLKTKGIYLIPGFGGAAVAAEKWKSSRDEAYIAIMGPLAGLVFITPMIGFYYLTLNPMFIAIASIMSLINLINLFPINPLDGGRVVKALLFSFKSSIGFTFALASVFIAIFASHIAGLSLLVYISIIGLFEIVVDYGLGQKLHKLILTIYRGLFFYLCYSFVPHIGSSLLVTISVSVFLIVGILLIIFDIRTATSQKDKSVLLYPIIILQDAFIGVRDLFSLKPGDLKRVDDYKPMEKKIIGFYAGAYLFTAGLMAAIVLFAEKVPGCELGKKMLM